MTDTTAVLKGVRENIRRELFESVLPFWDRHSVDPELGGFFACLDKDGERYDDRKFMWLNGRQVYMYAAMALSFSQQQLEDLSGGRLDRAKLIKDATAAADFMYSHGVRESDGQVYFSLTRHGQPYHMERKIFSAAFLCLGLGVLSAALRADGCSAKAGELEDRCVVLLKRIVSWSHDPSPLGKEACAGAPKTSPLNVPMILLNVLDELQRCGALSPSTGVGFDVAAEEAWCVEEILKHVRFEEKKVLEAVLADGSPCPGYDGRHMIPGHAIEAGWFLLRYAERTGEDSLVQTAEHMISWSFEEGWDPKHGGLFYFLDAEGRSPVYLEWDMKLWWPHNEAMIAYALLYERSRQDAHLQKFVQVGDWALRHFSDAAGGGEWYGYLSREGRVTHRFKGGPFKGCFHVPRCLLMVYQILGRCLEPTPQPP
ncbi:Renbp [Symbiodinium natans]|uniref:N-acylglucosamine 2-epimerase n=1 Tax=Symbiodinium natans TaxID=878477 RepID=A0A812PFM5_9DINO|nr:Renbp [Symbiodinium natans]